MSNKVIIRIFDYFICVEKVYHSDLKKNVYTQYKLCSNVYPNKIVTDWHVMC